MRLVLLILLLGISVSAFAQQWPLHSYDSTKVYGYQYRIQMPAAPEDSYHEMAENFDYKAHRFQVLDESAAPLPFVALLFTNKKTGKISEFNTDYEGYASPILDAGQYELRTIYMGRNDYRMQVEVAHPYAKISITLGEHSLPTIYEVYSKSTLSDEDIQQIIDCLKAHKEPNLAPCQDRDRYYVMIQI